MIDADKARIVIEEFNRDHTYGRNSLFVVRLRAQGLSDEHVAGVLLVVDSTCNECWDSDDGCQCWNDE